MMDSSSVSFCVQLTMNDLYRANLRFLVRKLRFLWVILIFAMAILIFILLSNSPQKQQVMLNIAPLFYLVAIWPLVLFVAPYLSARSNFKSQKALQLITNYTFSGEGIETESDAGSSRSNWSNIYQVVETRSYFFVYPGRNLRYVIPKRFIPEETKILELRQIFRAGVKGKIKLRG